MRLADSVLWPAAISLDEHLIALAWSDGLVFGANAVSPFPDTSLIDRADRAVARGGLPEDHAPRLMPGNEAEAAGLLDAYPERANTAARPAQVEG